MENEKKGETKDETTAKSEYDRLLNQLKVVQADFENYKKRIDRENKEYEKYANSSLLKDLLPTIDAFDKALVLSKDEGIKMLYHNFKKTLEKHGLKEIKSIGEKFDVNHHEAVLNVTGRGENNIVVEEVEKGYLLHDRVLRPAKVIVNKKA